MSAGSGPFADFAATWQPRIEEALQRLLPPADEAPEELHAAMRYSMFPGGKRLRPILALLGARLAGADPETVLVPAAGLECLHTYSLIHDDLPCMDDDELRRGRPTCHVRFGEATALLAGDALQTLALEAAAEGGAEAVRALARAAGSRGMVGGQVADLAAEGGAQPTLEQVRFIHDRKTGALLRASLEVGACAGGCRDLPEELTRFGDLLGRAFQVADDCLDLTGSAEELGKTPGKDLATAKATYPAVLGLEGSRAEAGKLAAEAAQLAVGLPAAMGRPAGLDLEVALLQDVAYYAANRSH